MRERRSWRKMFRKRGEELARKGIKSRWKKG
jgi:hypothetical protein